MKIVQLNQYLMLAEVVLRKSCGSCGSSKNKPIESMTYLRKFVAEVVCIPVRGIEKRGAPTGRASLSSEFGRGV